MIASRIAIPVRDLARSTAFYRHALRLPHTGGFRGHDGYDGDFFSLPGGGELELTSGPHPPANSGDEDLLLVLYVAGHDSLDQWVDDLHARGIRPVSGANPYWNRTGVMVLDPDGYRVVIAVVDPADWVENAPAEIDWHVGDRAELRALFQLAEDSAQQLTRYLASGEVLVARRDSAIIGHLQLVPTGTAGETELKNMAVLPQHQGGGVGRALVAEAVRRASQAGFQHMIVATAAADIGNIRFYQRVGFRMRSIEPDAFTPESGYPDAIVIDGIELRDRIWFTRVLTA